MTFLAEWDWAIGLVIGCVLVALYVLAVRIEEQRAAAEVAEMKSIIAELEQLTVAMPGLDRLLGVWKRLLEMREGGS